MIQVTIMDIREGHTEKKRFNNETELNKYLNKNPFVIVKRKDNVQ